MTTGPYTKLREIDRNGLTRTWLARGGDGREYYLACMPANAAEDVANRLGGTVLKDRVERLSQLDHPNIQHVHGESTLDGEWRVAFDPGPATWLPELAAAGAVAPERAFPILRGVARALDHIGGKGIVLGSLHPAMIGLGDQGPVLSIGLDWIIQPSIDAVEPDEIWPIGNPSYLSPEMLRGQAPGAEGDRYSFALIAWEVLTGRSPFSGHSLMDDMVAKVEGRFNEEAGLPRAALDVLKRGLDTDPAHRWPSAGEFVDQLEHAVVGNRGALGGETYLAAATLLRLEGTVAMAFAPAHGGTIIQLVGSPGRPVRVRVVNFLQGASDSDVITVPWEELGPVLPALHDACSRPLAVRGQVDSSDAATRLVLDLNWNQMSTHLVLDAMATGFEGPDAQLVERIVEFLDALAGTNERRRRLWQRSHPA